MKKTIEQQKAELEAQHAKKMAELDIEGKLLAALPAGFPEPASVHVYPLYDRCASLSFGEESGEKFVSLEAIEQIAAVLVPMPLVLVRDSCVSFQTRSHVDSLPESKNERWESETDVAPFIVEHKYGKCELSWFANLAGPVVEVNCVVSPWNMFGRLQAKRVEYRGGFRYENARLEATGAFSLILRDGETLAEMGQIKFAAGSPEYVNPFTIYWTPYREDRLPTIADLVATMKAQTSAPTSSAG